jgi:soluble lytic murein transglycosylase-like protein
MTIPKRQVTPRKDLVCWVLALAFFVSSSIVLAKPTTVKNTHYIDPELRELLKTTIAGSSSFVDRYDAEVWLVSKSNRLSKFVKNPEQRLRILKAVHREASRHKLPPELVLAVIEVESHFNRFAISHAGAQGMMQIMPFWKKEIGRPEDNLTKLNTNLQYGCTILAHYHKRSKRNWAEALARYNGSYGSSRYSNKVIFAWDKWR